MFSFSVYYILNCKQVCLHLLPTLFTLQEESLTIFAPTDDAFDQLPRQAVDELFNDPNALVDLLTKHVVKSTLLSPSLTFKELETAGGQSINVKVRRGRVFIEDARLIDGKNGEYVLKIGELLVSD